MLKAVIFDFDGTLTPNIRPSFQILEVSGLKDGASNPQFFKDVLAKAEREQTDIYDAMARLICDIAKGAGYDPTDENLSLGADQREYNPGVIQMLNWLQQNHIDSFLISSGLKNYLRHTALAPYFKEIYATTFCYDEQGCITDLNQVMSAENKALALREVAEDINGDPNDFSGIVYVGDGATDLVAMRHIKAHGGKAILVHLPEDSLELQEAQATGAIDLYDLMKQAKGVVDLYTLADFRQDSEAMAYLRSLQES